MKRERENILSLSLFRGEAPLVCCPNGPHKNQENMRPDSGCVRRLAAIGGLAEFLVLVCAETDRPSVMPRLSDHTLTLRESARSERRSILARFRSKGWSYGSVIFSHIMFYHDFAHVF